MHTLNTHTHTYFIIIIIIISSLHFILCKKMDSADWKKKKKSYKKKKKILWKKELREWIVFPRHTIRRSM